MPEFTLQARRRTVLVLGTLFFLATALFGRLLDLQVFRHDELLNKAKDVIYGEIVLHARRGRIFDSLGRPLALNMKGYVLWIDGPNFKGEESARWMVAQLCDWAPPGAVPSIVAGQTKSLGFFLCSRWVEEEIAQQLTALVDSRALQGVLLEVEPRRFYPYGTLFAHILGYLQDHGDLAADEETSYLPHGGVEEYYHDTLRGTDGWVHREKDPSGFMIPTGYRAQLPPQDGAQITLTVDLNIQYQAYKLLTEAVQKAGARRGDIVVLDPSCGAILTMVSYPSFDPNDIFACARNPDCEPYMHINPPVGIHYEPGSTMKILTMAIALNEHLIRPDTSFECSGVAVVGDTAFYNWNHLAHGHETVAEILLHSCNVGAVTISQLIEPEVYYRYLRQLGFGRPTGVDMANEAGGAIRTPDMENWSPVDKAANSFGQAINVTPLQLASAVAAVANGGELWQPYIVHTIQQNGVVTQTVPTLRGRVFREESCRQVTDMLTAIADVKGPDGGPLIPGYRLALKTGTAQIPIEGAGYEPHRTIASAIGYAPADDARFVILVRIEGNNVIWGEEVAVPVLEQLSRFLLAYLHIPPSAGEGSTGP